MHLRRYSRLGALGTASCFANTHKKRTPQVILVATSRAISCIMLIGNTLVGALPPVCTTSGSPYREGAFGQRRPR